MEDYSINKKTEKGWLNKGKFTADFEQPKPLIDASLAVFSF